MTNIVTVCCGSASLIANAFGMNLLNDWKEEESGAAFLTIASAAVLMALVAGGLLIRKYAMAEVLADSEAE